MTLALQSSSADDGMSLLSASTADNRLPSAVGFPVSFPASRSCPVKALIRPTRAGSGAFVQMSSPPPRSQRFQQNFHPLGGGTMSTASRPVGPAHVQLASKSEERRVIFASSLGTVFEWYDFYLYATLAPFFAALFFPKGNDTAALLSAFATYAAGFLVRPFGAIVFGRIGDLVGRKYTFLVTIVVMGSATFAVGLLPTLPGDRLGGADPAGHAAPGAGSGARRRIRRCGDLCRRARAARSARLRHELDPDHRDPRILPGAGW